MKMNFKKKKKTTFIIAGLALVSFVQAIVIAKLYTEQEKKEYTVNLVKINTEKDSVDYAKMKSDLIKVDRTIADLNNMLASKSIRNPALESLAKDSISNTIYLAKQSNRYSSYLHTLQEKLQNVPLGIPTSGYVSSLFGMRKNPIPTQVNLASVGTNKTSSKTTTIVEEKEVIVQAPPVEKFIEVEDDLGNKRQVKVMVTPKPETKIVKTNKTVTTPMSSSSKSNATVNAEGAHQMQFHKGVDFAVPVGTDVWAAAKGTVIFAGQKGGYGNCVIISHANGIATLYGHLSKVLVKANDKVDVGQVIAKSGNTGRSTGPHLHYEVHRNNTPVNPKLFLN